jgi:cytochrome c-type biogenesis protein CcmH/NrfF
MYTLLMFVLGWLSFGVLGVIIGVVVARYTEKELSEKHISEYMHMIWLGPLFLALVAWFSIESIMKKLGVTKALADMTKTKKDE